VAVKPTAVGTAGESNAWGDTAGERMLSGLLDAAHQVSPDDLTDVVAEYAVIGDLTDPVIYLADVQQDLLIPLPARRPARALPVRGTLAGRVFTGPEVVVRGAVRGAGSGGDPTAARARGGAPRGGGARRVGAAKAVPAGGDREDRGAGADRAARAGRRPARARAGVAGRAGPGEQAGLQRHDVAAGAPAADEPGRGDAVGAAAAAQLRDRTPA
jgi:hypothetical protein